jgi:hypothetical protein
VVLAGLALVAATVILLWLPRDPITWKNFDRIPKGMTRAEVEAILGPPNLTIAGIAGLRKLEEADFEPGPAIRPWGDDYVPDGEETHRWWVGNAGVVGVTFENDRVVLKSIRPRAGPLTRLRPVAALFPE